MTISRPRSAQAAPDTATQTTKASAQAARVDLIAGMRDGTLSYREAAVLIGCTQVQAQYHAEQLRTLTSEYSLNRLEKSLRKQAQMTALLGAARRVKEGSHIDAVAKEMGVSVRTLYRYVEQV